MKSKVKYLLFIIPLILLFVCLKIERPKYGCDPEYAYLLNSLNNAYFNAAGHIDHPGTTLQVFGAVVLRTAHLFDFSSDDDLQTAVLKNPDHYVEILNKILLLLNIFIFIYVGFVVYKYSQNIWISFIVQLTPLYSGVIVEFLATKVTPELFLSIASVLLLAQLIKYNYEPGKNINKKIILFSLISGFGVATKVNFIPIIIIPLIVLPSIRNKFLYFIGTIISFMIFTIPIMSQYNTFYQWITAMLTHKGIYGGGESGFIDIVTYIPNIKYLLEYDPAFSITLVISFLVIIVSLLFNLFNKKKMSISLKILIALVISQILDILIVAKHVNGYYLYPSFCLFGGNLFFIIICIKQLCNDLAYKLKWQIQIFSVLIILATSLYITPIIKKIIYSYKLNRYDYNVCNQLIQKSYNNYTKICSSPYSFVKYSALYFGNVYSKRQNLQTLNDLYPKYKNIYDWNTDTITIVDLLKKNKNIALIGSGIYNETITNFEKKGVTLNSVYNGATISIYKFIVAEQLPKSFNLVCNSEELAKGGNCFVTNLKNFYLQNGNTQSKEKSHTGKYCCKLNSKSPYGMTFNINNINKGDNFNVSVWRFSSNNEGLIVASATKSSEFYLAENKIIKKDINGWQLIELNFSVNKDIKDNNLGIYLWNNGKSDVFFDDLKIIRN